MRSLPALSVVALAMTVEGALAQAPPPAQHHPPTNAATRAWEAPIGHRQPTQKDLGPDTTRNEESDNGRAVRDFGPLPSICRGC
jgi:hypothetical protein